MPNRAATDAALNPKRGAPKRATGQQIAFLPLYHITFHLVPDLPNNALSNLKEINTILITTCTVSSQFRMFQYHYL